VLRGAVGTGYRPPSIGELFDDFGFFVGNPDLDPETSTSVEAGIDQVWANGAILSATVFESRIDDLITFVSGAPSTLENISGESRIRGIEFGGRVPLGAMFTGYGALTWLDAEDAAGAALPRTPERDLVLGLEAAVTDRLSGDLWVQAVSGIPEVDDFETLNASLSYAVNDRMEVFVRAFNLTDEQYQTAPGYGTADRSFFVGFDARF
jgi:vitamin B12 transporter